MFSISAAILKCFSKARVCFEIRKSSEAGSLRKVHLSSKHGRIWKFWSILLQEPITCLLTTWWHNANWPCASISTKIIVWIRVVTTNGTSTTTFQWLSLLRYMDDSAVESDCCSFYYGLGLKDNFQNTDLYKNDLF